MIVGILLQRIKGMGVLFGYGLLLNKAFLGWMIIFGLFLRSTFTVFATSLVSDDVIGSFSTIFSTGSFF